MTKEKKEAGQAVSAKTIKSMGSWKVKLIVIVVLIVEIILLTTGIMGCVNAQEVGDAIGSEIGKFTGCAVGSYEGFTKGWEKGAESGKKQGLSAEDTHTRIVNAITRVGKLDVLVAEDQLTDFYEQGTDYEAVLIFEVSAIFSIDLYKAEIAEEDSVLRITLPVPEVEITIDENKTSKFAEWQKHFWSGSEKDGYTGYQNSVMQIREKTAEELENYNVLMEQAKISAEKQVKILAGSVCGREKEIQIIWEEER